MIVIDHSKLQEVITAYKKYFPTHIGDEIYKWKAVKQFQDHRDTGPFLSGIPDNLLNTFPKPGIRRPLTVNIDI